MRYLLIVILVSGILIMGCDQGTGEMYNPYTGSKGLEMSFEQGSPPEETYEGQDFSVIVRAKNEGATAITNGLMKLGYEEGFIEAVNDEQYFDLYGRSTTMDVGEEKFVYFRLKSRKLDPQMEVLTTLLSVSSCYEYQTVFAEEICVDTDPLGKRFGEKNCQAEDIRSSGQGAPLVITNVEVEMLPNEDEGKITPVFKLTVENKGNGIVNNVNKAFDACSSGKIDREDINTVYVAEARLSNDYELECKPQKKGYEKGYIKLRDEESEIRCTYEGGLDIDTAPFTAPLYVKLSYGYQETITENVLIRKEV